MHSIVDIEFAPLVDKRREIPRVARWWCDEWGLPARHSSFEEYVQELEASSVQNLPKLAPNRRCPVMQPQTS